MKFSEAKWITMGSLPEAIPENFNKMHGSIYLRKSFELEEMPSKAELIVCALGIGVSSVNGKRAGEDVLSTPFTAYDKRVIYRSYDITNHLKAGKNAIGIHIGNGFYNDNMTVWNDIMASWKDHPKAAAVLNITLKSGKEIVVTTGSDWKCIKGPSVYNHVRQGEFIDARLRQDGFDMPDFDDSLWENASIICEPGGIYEPMTMPEIKVIRSLKPVKYENGIYDFGENISGRVKITATGETGREIRLIYDEAFKENGEFFGEINEYTILDDVLLKNEDVFVLSGKENEEFAVEFCYHGFRYVKVVNAPEKFEIVAEVIHTDLKKHGDFSCDDDILNKLHSATVQSTLTNYMGIPTDCPHREQLGWTNDAHISAEQALMNFDMYSAYDKWMNDFKDAQRPSGQIPGIIPSSSWGYNVFSGAYAGSSIVLIPWYTYKILKTKALIEKMWDNMSRFMKHLEKCSENYILGIGLPDWNPVRFPCCPTEVIATAYLYSNSIIMGKMAELIGENPDEWNKLADNTKASWRRAFLNNKELECYQTYWACAIYQGLLSKEEEKAAAEKLNNLVVENGYHIDCGLFGTKYIFSALSENGYIETVYKMVVNPTYPSYGYWIYKGQTTLCENWNMTQSRNHHMFSEVDNWMYKYIGGIHMTEEGITIKPYILENVSKVTAEHRGIKVERDNNTIRLTTPVKVQFEVGKIRKELTPGEYEFII